MLRQCLHIKASFSWVEIHGYGLKIVLSTQSMAFIIPFIISNSYIMTSNIGAYPKKYKITYDATYTAPQILIL